MSNILSNLQCPFRCFGLTPTTEVDVTAIDKIYFSLQQVLHPDRFVGKPMGEQTAALRQSAAINQAYECLKHPINRLWAYLDAHGIQVDRAQNINTAPDLVEKVFELQDQASDLQSVTDQQNFITYLKNKLKEEQLLFKMQLEQQESKQAILTLHWMTYIYKILKDTENTVLMKVA